MKSPMVQSFAALMRREYWENRGGFMITPIVISAILFLATAALLIGIAFAGGNIHVDGEEIVTLGDAVRNLSAETKGRELGLATFQYAVSSIFSWAMTFVLLFYFLGSLWDDRKDRSILFWKSLPVSDLKTVLSKLATGLTIAPAFTLAGIILTHVLLLSLMTIVCWFSGVGAWETFWAPANPPAIWLNLLVAFVIHGLWMLPVWGWVMLASAAARGFFRPFLIAVLVPLLLGLVDLWFSIFGRWQSLVYEQEFSSTIFPIIGERLGGSVLPLIVLDGDETGVYWNNIARAGGEYTEMTLGLTLDRFSEPALWWGLLFGSACIALAVYLRRFRDNY